MAGKTPFPTSSRSVSRVTRRGTAEAERAYRRQLIDLLTDALTMGDKDHPGRAALAHNALLARPGDEEVTRLAREVLGAKGVH